MKTDVKVLSKNDGKANSTSHEDGHVIIKWLLWEQDHGEFMNGTPVRKMKNSKMEKHSVLMDWQN